MSEERMFSVIIPVHNKAPHIRRSISSVLNQTFGDFELIVIDDASTDGSLEEIHKFQDARIRVLRRDTPGSGGYAARNLGIREAKGRWIAFLDADDEWLPEHLQRMTELAARFPDRDFLSCGWMNAYEKGKTCVDRFTQRNRTQRAREISFKEYLECSVEGMVPACTDVVCLRNNHVARDLFPEGKAARGGDRHAWITYLAHTKSLALSPHLGAIYYRDTVNMVTKNTPGNPNLTKKIMADLRPLLDHEHVRLLSKFANRRIWVLWFGDLFIEPYNSFNLAANLSWKGDFWFCFLRSVIGFIPAPVFRFARRLKRKFTNHVESTISVRK